MNRTDDERAARGGPGEGLARALGWFSLGLGAAALFAPRRVGRLVGVHGHEGIIRGVGIRELVSGMGLLAVRRPAGWAWSRVAGDLMDLSLLGAAFTDRRSDTGKVASASAAVAGVALLDLACAQGLGGFPGGGEGRLVEIRETVTVLRPREELYRFWRQLENLPSIMPHVESVKSIDERRSHWVVKGPGGTSVEWDAEITEDRPMERIEWRSIEPAEVPNSGSVEFKDAPQGRGTEVSVTLRYEPPAGFLGRGVAKLFGEEPGQQLSRDLRTFRQLLETGEVATTHGQPSGRSSGETLLDRIAP